MIDSGDEAVIARVIDSYTRDNDRLVDQLLQLQYYWRGAMSRDDMWAMSPIEREKATEFINNRFKEIGEAMKKGITISY